jgi:uncharacterized phiE125 gp8 family phage protein
MLVELEPFEVEAPELGALAAHLRMPTGFEADPAVDADLRQAFDAARAVVERAAGRALKRRAFRATAAAWDGGMILPMAPAISLLAVVVEDAEGAETALPLDGHRIDALSTPPRVATRAGVAPPSPPYGGCVRVDYLAGDGPAFADAPADLRAATLVIAARWYEAWGAGEADVAIPASAEALLAPYRRIRL